MPETNPTKKCCTCKKIKLLSEFYRHCKSKDGLQGRCKTCNRQHNKTDAVMRYYAQYRKSDASKRSKDKYSNSDSGKINRAEYMKSDDGKLAFAKYRSRNKGKIKAQGIIGGALRAGRITVPDNCEKCAGTAKLDGHHDDYSLPLLVRWLCRKCHKAWHIENGHGLNG